MSDKAPSSSGNSASTKRRGEPLPVEKDIIASFTEFRERIEEYLAQFEHDLEQWVQKR